MKNSNRLGGRHAIPGSPPHIPSRNRVSSVRSIHHLAGFLAGLRPFRKAQARPRKDPASLIALAASAPQRGWDERTDFVPSLALGVLPLAALPWAMAVAGAGRIEPPFFGLAIVLIGPAAAGLSARRWLPQSARWNRRAKPLHIHL